MEKKTAFECYMIKKGKPCVKTTVDEAHQKNYECESCLWHMTNPNEKTLKSLDRLYKRYSKKHEV